MIPEGSTGRGLASLVPPPQRTRRQKGAREDSEFCPASDSAERGTVRATIFPIDGGWLGR